MSALAVLGLTSLGTIAGANASARLHETARSARPNAQYAMPLAGIASIAAIRLHHG